MSFDFTASFRATLARFKDLPIASRVDFCRSHGGHDWPEWERHEYVSQRICKTCGACERVEI